jgi:predicted permease
VQSGLVVLEVALALTLGAGAGLLYRSVRALYAEDLGFRPEGVLVARIQPPVERYPAPADFDSFLAAVLDGVRALPGVQAAGFGSFAPLTWSGAMIYYRPPGWVDRGVPPDLVYLRLLTPGYFEALGTRLLRGRLLAGSDGPGGPPVALVNEAFVRKYLPDRSPLGARLPVESYGLDQPTVVGVVEDVRLEAVDVEPRPVLYMPQAQVTGRNPSYDARDLVLRTRGDPASFAAAVRAVVREVDPTLPVEETRTLAAVLDDTLEASRFHLRLLVGFASFAVGLACLGTFAVVSYGVQTRVREIGIRMALGADTSRVQARVVGVGGRLIVLGVAAGTAGALLLGRFFEGLLHRTSPRDPLTLAMTAVLVAGAALLASWLPARRASRVDPARVLRPD